MKNILLSSLVVVSLIGSANMFAMQTGDASKVQALIDSKKVTEQTLAAFAKISGKLKDKLGISDADYKAYLAQKGGGATTGEAVPQFHGEEAPPKITPAITPKTPVPAQTKGIVITPVQIARFDTEITSITQAMSKFIDRVEALALLTGNQEDAQSFVNSMQTRFKATMDAMEKTRKKVDFSSLPHKEKKPLTKDEKEVYVLVLQSKFNDFGNVNRPNQKWALDFINEELDKDFKEHDDSYFIQVIKSQGWKE